MAQTTIASQVRRLARAAFRRTAGRKRTAELAAVVQQRNRARAEAEVLRGRVAVLREQRERGRHAAYALGPFAQGLDVALDSADGAKRLRRALRELRGQALLTDRLLQGDPLDEAIVASARSLLINPRSVARARAFCTALMADERTRPAAAVALGLYLLVWGSRENAHEHFRQAPPDLLARTAAKESVACALKVDPPAGRRLAETILAHPDLSAQDAFAIAGLLVGHHHLSLARRALERARAAGPLGEGTAKDVDRLQHWIDEHPAELDTVAPPRRRPALGLIHYDHPHYEGASSNLGDYTQTVALLGHVLRRRGLELHSDDPELGAALDTLRSAISPDLMLDTPPAKVDIVPVSRDASRWEEIPESTWMIAFGWYMHSLFKVRSDLPFHRGIRPIFLSFHVNKPDILTPEAVAYLRRYGPVGCRDWTTVDLLLSHGVDAFFSGCVTTTTHITGGRRSPDAPVVGSGVGRIDARTGTTHLTQATTDINDRPLAANLLAAHERHRLLRDSYESLHTSRLHVYLPAVSMGVPVEFEPRNLSDIRFEGLSGLAPDSSELREMQERITGLLDGVLGFITSGADEETIYAAWRDRTRALVEKARARREHWRTTRLPVESFSGVAAPVRERAVHLGSGGDVHVAIALDSNLVDEAPVVLQGIEENTARDVRVHVLTRGVSGETVEAWTQIFPRLRFSHYRFDDVDYGSITGMLSHTTVSTMDRLLLPEVLAGLERVVYIDIDVAVLGDVGQLWDLPLGGAPLAARPTASEWAESGLAFINRAAMRLPADVARELRAYMHARLNGDFVSFNAGILVLDLARMRADDFVGRYAGMAGRYGLNDQDVLCCYAGTDAVALDSRWNTFPTRESVPDDVQLLHFAGGGKPWNPLPLPAKDVWLQARSRYLAKLAADQPVRRSEGSGEHRLRPMVSNYLVDELSMTALDLGDNEDSAAGQLLDPEDVGQASR